MYGSDAGQPVPSLYTKGLSPLCDFCGVFIEKYVYTKFRSYCVSDLHGYNICPYHNVWPETVYYVYGLLTLGAHARGLRCLSVCLLPLFLGDGKLIRRTEGTKRFGATLRRVL